MTMEYIRWNVLLLLKCFVFFTTIAGVNLVELCKISYTGGDMTANCSGNRLQHIPYDIQHNIKTLDLRNNFLRVIDEIAFAKYDLLTHLYLQNNSLTELKKDAFAHLKDLKYLDLSKNALTNVPTQSFNGLSSLLELNMRGNKISQIYNDAFINLPSLTSLYLDGNYIEDIGPNAFRGLNFLQFLDLQNNALKSLKEKTLQSLTYRFKSIKLYNNPWYCNCKIRWLNNYLKNSSRDFPVKWIFSEGEPKCKSPSMLNGALFSTLNESQLLCQIIMYSSGYDTEIQQGKPVRLMCKYYSEPVLLPTWLKNGKEILPNDKKIVISNEGSTVIESVLAMQEFQKGDTGEYKCFVQNARGPASISFVLSLKDYDPSVETSLKENDPSIKTLAISETTVEEKHTNTKTIQIALSVVGGFLFLILLVGFIVFLVIRCKRKQRQKFEERSQTFKEHLKTAILNEKDIMETKSDLKPSERDTQNPKENDPLYDHVDKNQAEPNTYVSFQANFTEPRNMNELFNDTSKTKSSDSSQCESTSPLLDNCSPILCESYDPLYELSQNNSYYHSPRLIPKASTMNSRYLPSESSYDTYLSYTPYSTLSNSGQYSMPPNNQGKYATLPGKRSASTTYLYPLPPKKPPRLFHSRDSMSLNSQTSQSTDNGEHMPRLSLPKPGTVDRFGTAV